MAEGDTETEATSAASSGAGSSAANAARRMRVMAVSLEDRRVAATRSGACYFASGTTLSTASTSRPLTRTFGCFGSIATAESFSFVSPAGVVGGIVSLNAKSVSPAFTVTGAGTGTPGGRPVSDNATSPAKPFNRSTAPETSTVAP